MRGQAITVDKSGNLDFAGGQTRLTGRLASRASRLPRSSLSAPLPWRHLSVSNGTKTGRETFGVPECVIQVGSHETVSQFHDRGP